MSYSNFGGDLAIKRFSAVKSFLLKYFPETILLIFCVCNWLMGFSHTHDGAFRFVSIIESGEYYVYEYRLSNYLFQAPTVILRNLGIDSLSLLRLVYDMTHPLWHFLLLTWLRVAGLNYEGRLFFVLSSSLVTLTVIFCPIEQVPAAQGLVAIIIYCQLGVRSLLQFLSVLPILLISCFGHPSICFVAGILGASHLIMRKELRRQVSAWLVFLIPFAILSLLHVNNHNQNRLNNQIQYLNEMLFSFNHTTAFFALYLFAVCYFVLSDRERRFGILLGVLVFYISVHLLYINTITYFFGYRAMVALICLLWGGSTVLRNRPFVFKKKDLVFSGVLMLVLTLSSLVVGLQRMADMRRELEKTPYLTCRASETQRFLHWAVPFEIMIFSNSYDVSKLVAPKEDCTLEETGSYKNDLLKEYLTNGKYFELKDEFRPCDQRC